MLRFFLILFTALIITFFLRKILKSILTYFNKNSSSPVSKVKKSEDKKTITYDKSKVVDAEFEEIK